MLFTPGWILRGQAMATALVLFGPWPDSSMCLAGVIPFIASSLAPGSAAGVRHHRPHQEWGSSSPSSASLGPSYTTESDLP